MKIAKKDIQDLFPLTPLQEGMFFHDQLGDSSAFMEQFVYEINSTLDIKLLENAFNTLIARHDVLRAAFIYKTARQPIQVILKERKLKVHFENLSGAADQEEYIEAFKEKDKQRSFLLDKELLMRVAVFQREPNRFVIVWTYHHIILDGWSYSILASEFFAIYQQLVKGEKATLPPAPPFRNYLAWLKKHKEADTTAFWKSYLEDYNAVASVSADKTQSLNTGYVGKVRYFTFPQELTAAVRQLGNQLNVTTNTIIQAVWGLLLGKHNGCRDVVYGAVVSGRPSEIDGVEQMVGLFINTIPVRVRYEAATSFSELVSTIQLQALEAEPHHFLSLAVVQSLTDLRNNLLDHLLVFENFPVEEQIKDANNSQSEEAALDISEVEVHEQTNYNFNAQVVLGEQLVFKFSYNSLLYSEAQIERIGDQLEGLTIQVTDNPSASVSQLHLLNTSECAQQVEAFNPTAQAYPADSSIVELFREQCRQTPNARAVVFDGQPLSYQELDQQSNQVAHWLREVHGVTTGSFVALIADRSQELIINILGILKAGAAYAPIESKYSEEYIHHVLTQTKASVLFYDDESLVERISLPDLKMVGIKDWQNSEAPTTDELPEVSMSGDSLAYVMYTSGSTGQPKGVLVSHRNVISLVKSTDFVPLSNSTRVLQSGAIAFDASTFEIWAPLLNGGELHLLKGQDLLDIARLKATIAEQQINTMFLTTSWFNQIVDIDVTTLQPLKYLLIGGEAMSVKHSNLVLAACPDLALSNNYGPTENTTFSMFEILKGEQEGSVPLGFPLTHRSAYVLDIDGHLLPPGIAGELYVGGAGVAQGYLQMPEQTAERFQELHIGGKEDRVYRTGDIVRWTTEGNMIYIGRRDKQIKLRGYRIELNAIVQQLEKHTNILKAEVLKVEDSLVAYYTCANKEDIDLNNFLSAHLPQFMLPQTYICLEEFPLTTNGKTNYRLLPKPVQGQEIQTAYLAPRNELDTQLTNIWLELLEAKKIGIRDNFFDLGGHSLKAMRMVAEIQKQLEKKLPLKSLFDNPTIEELSDLLAGEAVASYVAIPKVEEREYYALSHAQQRLWVLSRMESSSRAFNMQAAYNLGGAVDEKALLKAWADLVKRHESLRTAFEEHAGQSRQLVLDYEEARFGMIIKSLKSDAEEEECFDDLLNTIFDLSDAPLYRAVLMKKQDNTYVFALIMHHIITDGWSMDIIYRELLSLYKAHTTGRPAKLPALKIQYKDFAQWQQQELQTGGALVQQQDYWMNQFADGVPVLDLPLDYRRPATKTFVGSLHTLSVEKEVFTQLKAFSTQLEVSPFAVVLSAVYTLLFRYSNQDDIVLGTPVAGREHPDLHQQVGFYVNMLPIRLRKNGEMNFSQLVKEVHNQLLDSYANQSYPFDLLVEQLKVERDASRSPVYDVGMTWQESINKEEEMDAEFDADTRQLENTTARGDLWFYGSELTDSLYLSIEFNTDLYHFRSIERMGGHLLQLLKDGLVNGSKPIQKLNLLTAIEEVRLVETYAGSSRSYPSTSIPALFNSIAQQYPDHTALVVDQRRISYKELDIRSSQLATYLIEQHQLQKEDCVGILIDRNEWHIISLLGILKAGGAYVPIEVTNPSSRINYMLEDSNCKVVITESERLIDLMNFYQGAVVAPDVELPDNWKEVKAEELVLNVDSRVTDLAYIIYTSGTTGRPKGVMIEQDAILRLILAQDYYPFEVGGKLLQTGSLAFDASTFEIWGLLLNGGELHLLPGQELLDVNRLKNYILTEKIDGMFLTTAWFNQIVDTDASTFGSLKCLLTGGEAMSVKHMNHLTSSFPDLNVSNIYGPTENTTFSLYYPVLKQYEEEVPIGKAIQNTQAYVLDNQLQLVPEGVYGELLLGGKGLSRGYVNNEEETAKRFVPNPFKVGELLYRTGDMVRWLEGGNIAFRGRKDSQVKLRGFRIELDEIDRRLEAHPKVQSARVLVHRNEDGNGQLVAYYTGEEERGEELKHFLSKELPEFMLPNWFARIERFPLNANGKLDRKQLPLPGQEVQTDEFIAPSTDLEKRLSEIWCSLLNKEQVGINDNFFVIGGDSIKAIRLISEVNAAFDSSLQVKDVFQHQDLGVMARFLEDGGAMQQGRQQEEALTQQHLQEWQEKQMAYGKENLLEGLEIEAIYPMSDIEKGMVYHNLLEPGSGVYHDQVYTQLTGEAYDPERLRKAYALLIEKHDMFRVAFSMYGFEEPAQLIYPYREELVDFGFQDISDRSEEGQRVFLTQYMEEDRREGFDFNKPGLCRFRLFKLGKQEYGLLWMFHHAILDGWSNASFLTELSQLYSALEEDPTHRPSVLKANYKDYILDQIKVNLDGQQEAFWKKELQEYSRTPLPLYPKIDPNGKIKVSHADLGRELVRDLEDFSKEQKVGIKELLLAGFVYLLKFTTNRQDILLGMVSNGRPDVEDGEKILGCFLNTVPVRFQLNTAMTAKEVIALTADKAKNLKRFDKLSLHRIMELTNDSTREANPYYDIMFNFLDFHIFEEADESSELGSRLVEDHTVANTLFDFTVQKSDGTIIVTINHMEGSYLQEDLDRLLQYYRFILKGMMTQPNQALLSSTVMEKQETQLCLETFNDTDVDYPSELCVHELFELQVKKNPEAIALSDHDEQLSYEELNTRANQLAHFLKANYELKPESVIAILTERTSHQIIALLAILKAGAAYVPIDPQYPKNRVKYILDELNPVVVLTDKGADVSHYGLEEEQCLQLIPAVELIKDQPVSDLKSNVQSHHLIYIIYTSGSTGFPKGVMVEHRGVARLVINSSFVPLSKKTVLLPTCAITFDVSTFEIWGTLLNGGQLILLTQEEMLDTSILKQFIKAHEVNTMWMTGGLCNRFVDEDLSLFEPLTTLIAGGEVLSPQHMQKLSDEFPQLQLVNGYGPTENTTFSTAHQINTIDPEGIPIGKPIANSQVYILDEDLQPVPIGVWGELYLAGDGLARGYYGKEELNNERFIYSPVIPNHRLYKSGDFGRWNAEGIIEFKGRADFQVKLRGYRIELSEIAFNLQQYPGIETAEVVLHQENGAEQLIAYYTGAELAASELSSFLFEMLPSYMLPTAYLRLESFPLSVSGKLDRSALPLPSSSDVEQEREYIPPVSPTEIKLQQFWQQLLAKEPIGITDNFFESGGHSIKAVQLNAAIYKELHVKLALKDIFLYPTIRELARQVDAQDTQTYRPIEPIEVADYYELSHAQMRLWTLHLLGNVGTTYHMPIAFNYNGELNREVLRQAWGRLLARHESLRTTFVEIDGLPRQQIQPVEQINSIYQYIDLQQDRDSLKERLKYFNNRVYDLEKGPLYRMSLMQLGEQEFVVAINIHHIIADGWSLGILQQELLELCEAVENNRAAKLSPLRIQYKDYSAWQQQQIKEDPATNTLRNYWLEQFAGDLPLIDLPTDKPRPAVKTFNGESLSLELPAELSDHFTALCKAQNVSPFAAWLAAYSSLLNRYTAQQDVVIGFPVSGREHPDLNQQIGFYVNMLPLRLQMDTANEFSTHLENVYQQVLQAFEHQQYPFDLLIEELNIPRDRSRSPLFDVGFNWVAGEGNSEEETTPTVNYASARLDLWLHVIEKKAGIQLIFEYNTDLFEEASIRRMTRSFENLVKAVVETPQTNLSNISLLDAEEQRMLLQDFNNTSMEYPRDKVFIELFAERVAQTPAAIAVVDGDQSYTYLQLDERSNQLAHFLKNKYNIEVEDRIGIQLERSADLILAILATHKSGAAYVPIDTSYPDERKAFIIEDSGLKVVITHSEAMGESQGELLVLDREEQWLEASKEQMPISNAPTDLAYIIYTSGSTGQPKGVMIEHRALLNLCYWHNDAFNVSAESRATLYASIGFDASVWEIFPYLIAGASLFPIPSANKLEASWIMDFLNHHKISHSFLPTAMFERLQQYFNDERYSQLTVLTGGDKLHHLESCKARVINNYGLTETAVVATSIDLTNYGKASSQVPIGSPIANTRIYIVNEDDQLMPMGATGELCISGDLLARGYLNRPEESKRFAPNPFEEGKLWYKTGDLGKWQNDGQIAFVGRKDFQVQINGHRVEPGEVEDILAKHEALDEVKVIALATDSTEYRLIAYFTTSAQQQIEGSTLRNYLQQKVPAFMVPAQFIALAAFPLTANGKIDAKQLPAPEMIIGNRQYAPARTPVEHILVAIWQRVLGSSPIGIKDNFFELGGDSIKAIQISAGLNEQGYRMKARDIFEYSDIQQLAAIVKKIERIPDQSMVVGTLPLNPVQHRFFDLNTQQHHYNQAFMFDSKDRLERGLVEKVFNYLQEHHDALRMRFSVENGEVVQYNTSLEEAELSLELVDLREEEEDGASIEEVGNRIQSSFDLEKGPLMKLVIFQRKKVDSLLIVIHHLVIDTVSWRILFEDIETLMKQAQEGSSFQLPLKTDSYKNWTTQLTEYAQSPQFIQNELPYWSRIAAAKGTALPVEKEGVNNLEGAAHSFSFRLSPEMTTSLLGTVHKAYNTEVNDLLLAGLSSALKETFGLSKVRLDLEGHGREAFNEELDVNRTVGWFTTVYPVLLDVMEEGNVSRHIRQVKESLRQIPARGIGYGLLKYSNPTTAASAQFDAKSEISFNYLGQFDSDLESSELDVADDNWGRTISPEEKRPYLLDVVGLVSNNRLTVTLIYHPEHFGSSTIEQLSTTYVLALEELVNHCLAQKERLPSPSDFTYNKLSIPQVEELNSEYPIDDIFPLSPMQENLFFLSTILEDSKPYLEQLSFQMSGELEAELIRKSLNALCQRHAVLRSTYLSIGMEQPLQLILQDCDVPLQFEDISNLPEEEKAERIRYFREKDLAQPFDLSSAPLMRAIVLKNAAQEYTFIWSYHHILFDGWCLSVLMNEFFSLYGQFANDNQQALPIVEDYKNYLSWLASRDRALSLKHWTNYLNGYEQLATFDQQQRIEVVAEANLPGSYAFSFSEALTERIKNLAVANQVTINIVLQSLWGILLAKYNGSKDVVFGSVVSGRPAEVVGIERMIGLFINTIPVRVQFESDTPFDELIKRMQQEALEIEPHHYMSLATIQAQTSLKANLLNHILAFENYPIEEELKNRIEETDESTSDELNIVDVDIHEQTNYDLNIQVGLGNQLTFKVSYNQNRFSEEQIVEIEQRLELLVDQVVARPEIRTAALSLLSEADKVKLAVFAQPSSKPFPDDQSIIDLFRKQVALTPENTAVVFHDQRLTYEELEAASDHMANWLRQSCQVKSGDFVALIADRNLELIVSILGILKAGAAYVPIEAKYPDEHIQHILQQINAKALIHDDVSISERIQQADLQLVEMGAWKNWEAPTLFNVDAGLSSADSLAYVMYTSGSTGVPKGVLINNRNVVSLVKSVDYVQLDTTTRLLQGGAIAFDASTFEIWAPLLNGGQLHLLKGKELLDVTRLGALMAAEKINTLFLTSAWFNQIVDIDVQILAPLRQLYTGGEVLSVQHINKLIATHPHIQLISCYGPTENTTFSTTYPIQGEQHSLIPIGYPLNNRSAYVMDEEGQLLPNGMIGELCVGGAGVGQGYLNLPELTADKFLDFVIGDSTERLYRTGDIVRQEADGRLLFIGRRDKQVKLNGYRIELGAIAREITTHEVILQAEVMKIGDRLVAYYVSEEGQQLELQTFLEDRLPGYMIPKVYLRLDEFPLTLNGKIDKKALPKLDQWEKETSQDYVAPRNEIERQLVEAWEKVLGISPIGIHDNFFEIGGDSLKAIRLVSGLQQDYRLSVNDIFKFPEIASFSQHLSYQKDYLFEKLNRHKYDVGAPLDEARQQAIRDEVDLGEKIYREKVHQYEKLDLEAIKRYDNVFLTGSTGYLGCHLLHQLLHKTNAHLHLLIRGFSVEEALKRLDKRYQHYFKEALPTPRLTIHCGDLGHKDLGLNSSTYAALTAKVDAIINAAANVKHYGMESDFDAINLEAINNLIQLASSGKKKDIHHISTLSVAGGEVEGKHGLLFTEYDCDVQQYSTNIYAQTKLAAEQQLLAARSEGINCSIYRVGNLVFDSKSGVFQENIANSSFYSRIKSFIEIGYFVDYESQLEFTQVDKVAEAILLIFNREKLQNETYHIHNHRLLYHTDFIDYLSQMGYPIEVIETNDFINFALTYYEDYRKQLDDLFLRYGLFEEEQDNETNFYVLSEKSQQVLELLSFEWDEPEFEDIERMIKHCQEVGFIHRPDSEEAEKYRLPIRNTTIPDLEIEPRKVIEEMKYRDLGTTGLKVSVLSFGSWLTIGNQITNQTSLQLIATAYENGINFFDNAEVYANGRSEIIMGNIFKKMDWPRESYLVSSKVFAGEFLDEKDVIQEYGLDRENILEACEQSLQRLQLDYLDLYLCHRADENTPMEEIVATMTELVNKGKIRFWGTSEWTVEQFEEATVIAKRKGLIAPSFEQPQYNMMHREKVEEEFAPLFAQHGIGLTTFSPLYSGILSGKYAKGIPDQSRLNLKESTSIKMNLLADEEGKVFEITRKLAEIAEQLGISSAQLAIGWCLKNPNVTSVLLGASKLYQLEENLKVVEILDLISPEVIDSLEEILQDKISLL